MREIKVGGRYRHFKGGEYKVLAIATHTETEESMVVYQNLSDPDKIWVRPYDMFASPVDRTAYPHVAATYRFDEIE